MNESIIKYFSTKSILYVEDEQDVRDNVKSYLEMVFVHVDIASNGEEALSIFDGKKHDVILTDLEMPKMSGLEFVSKLRDNGFETPVIVMSAHTTPEFTLQASELKLVKYLVKPFDGELFLNALLKVQEELNKIEEKVSLKENIKDLENRLESMEHSSQFDHLTKVLNRKALDSTLFTFEEEFHSKNIDYGIIFIDVDHFKKFNDTYGHKAGDKVLKSVGELLNATKEKVGRYGGEEFVVVIRDIDLETLFDFAESMREAIEELDMLYDENTLHVTASLGISLRSHHKNKADTLEFADQCMYEAKKSGRNKTVKKV